MAQELENVWLLPKHRLINLFEFSCQSKNSNLIAGFFLSKHRCKLTNLILPIKAQNWLIVWFYQWYKMNFQLICVLTREINLVNIYRLLIIFFQICFLTVKIQKIELKFLIWRVKSNEFICICVLTGKIQQIDLNFCFDM